jgi:UDP-N-acetylglucosamine/UDP-N-acetylgalactosamine 4-epimerase
MNMSNLNILVTGGAGFIGSNIVETLLKNDVNKVVVLDNLSTGYKKNIEPLLQTYPNLEFIYGDISNLEICRKAIKNIDVVCHQAALGSVPRSLDDPLSSHQSNVNGIFNILLVAKENNIKRVVYASSSSVYGDNNKLPKVENETGNVLSPYAANKAIAEIYANIFNRCYQMECIGLRYFNVFGPRQDPNGSYAAVIPKFVTLIDRGIQPIINGDGNYSRDFTYINNVVDANILAMTTKNSSAFGEVFNIGAGGRVTLIELINTIRKTLNSDIVPIFGEKRKGDIPHSNASIEKAKKYLSYEPKISFEKGIEKTIEYYCDREKADKEKNYITLK